MRAYRLFFLLLINFYVYSTEVVLLLDQINPQSIVNGKINFIDQNTEITDFWDKNWLNNLWYCVQNEISSQGFNLKIMGDFNKEKIAKIIYDTDYIIDGRGNSYEQVDLWANMGADVSEKLILIIWEPNIVCPSIWNKKLHQKCYRALVWNDSLVDNKKYFLFRYPVYTNFNFKIEKLIDFDKKKFLCMVSMNKKASSVRISINNFQDLYKERLKFINFCEGEKLDFDLFGKYWKHGEHGSYRGEISLYGKKDLLSHYKFCICYENSRETGYVSEKIFDCFRAGCIPVYYGANNIDELIPKNCFVDRRDFMNNESLYYYLNNISESEYIKYLKNIQNYLDSGAEQFSDWYFAKSLSNALM